MTNEVRRLKQKIKVLEQEELPVKQVCIDLLRLFDLEVNEIEVLDSNYEYYVTKLLMNYKKQLENNNLNNQNLKLWQQ